MAIYCIDYINGVNSPGGGTAVAPWKTIGYAETQITIAIGDEFRIHAGEAPTLLSTTAFQTAANSYVITTGVNLTSSLAAGDYIFLGSDLVQVYRIASITSTQITVMSNVQLYPEYKGANVTFEIYKAGGVPVTINTSTDGVDTFLGTSIGTINSDSVIISGGWDSTFTAKTAFGKTLFYRIGTLNPTSNIASGTIFKLSGSGNTGQGYVFKDFNVTGSFSTFIVAVSSTTVRSKTDGITISGIFQPNLIQGSGSTTDPIYHTNMTVVLSSDASGRTCTLYSSTWSSSTTQIIYLNNLTYYITGRINQSSATPTFRFNPISQSNSQIELGNLTIINRYNYILWGATETNQPEMLNLSSPASTDNNFVNYIKIDSLDIQGYNIFMFNSTSSSATRLFVPLTSANLAKINTIGITNRIPRVLTISAPGSPFSTASGNFVSPNQDSITQMGTGSIQPTVWKDTVANLDYYIYGQGICYLDTTNYSTGTNSLAVRPAAIGSVGNVYGFAIPAGISFFKKNSQTATITIKMKLLGSYDTTPSIRLQSNLTTTNSLSYPSGTGTFTTSNGINLLPSTNPNTSTWTDVVYTLPATTTSPGDLATGFNFVLYEGQDGSNLAEAGKWLLIDSVTITLS